MSLGESPEWIVGVLGALVLATALVVAVARWLVNGPRSPDPWEDEYAERVEEPETPLLCHRCLTPNPPGKDFCEECGAPIGQYTNYLPLPYLYSIGHLLRIGTAGEFRKSVVTWSGFVLLAIAEYMVFCPIYLYFLFRGKSRKPAVPGQGLFD